MTISLQSLSTEDFLYAFRKFVARQGKPTRVISDNAKHFQLATQIIGAEVKGKGGQKEERRLQAQGRGRNVLKKYLEEQGIEWEFIPELSPWMGGFYERLVAIVKECLRKELTNKNVTLVQLEVMVCEIECILNNRPLTACASQGDMVPIRPADFLRCPALPDLWDPELNDEKGETSKAAAIRGRWRKMRSIVNMVWQRWHKEYLTALRDYHCYDKQKKSLYMVPAVGDVVLIDDVPAAPKRRDQWKLGKVETLYPSPDKQIRVVGVRSQGQLLTRPIKKLYPVEFAGKDNEPWRNKAWGKYWSHSMIREQPRTVATQCEVGVGGSPEEEEEETTKGARRW